jgi:hypothetical protein
MEPEQILWLLVAGPLLAAIFAGCGYIMAGMISRIIDLFKE